MIDSNTVAALDLKSYTKSQCGDLYKELLKNGSVYSAIKDVIDGWKKDAVKLSKTWWVLNYFSEELDANRRLRAITESYLDDLVPPPAEVSEKAS